VVLVPDVGLLLQRTPQWKKFVRGNSAYSSIGLSSCLYIWNCFWKWDYASNILAIETDIQKGLNKCHFTSLISIGQQTILLVTYNLLNGKSAVLMGFLNTK
jgi:hypothetical protein